MFFEPPSLVYPTPPGTEKNSLQRALENKKTARAIFQYCDTGYDSVSTLRLVSKSWKKMVDPLWKSYRAPLAIRRKFTTLSGSVQWTVNGKVENLSKFIEQHQRSLPRTKCPHRNLILFSSIEEDPLDPKIGVWNSVDRRVWTSYLHNIAVLTFTQDGIPLVNDQIDPAFQAAMPHLERLTLKFCVLTCRERALPEEHDQLQLHVHPAKRAKYDIPEHLPQDEQRPFVWQKLKYVCLENVMFRAHPRLPPKTCKERLVLAFPNLTQVSLVYPQNYYNVTFEALETFKNNNVWVFEAPLEPLSPNSEMKHCFVKQLKMYSGLPKATNVQETQLEALCVHSSLFKSASSILRSGSLDNLTKLCLSGKVCKTLNFLRWMPKLKELKFNSYRRDYSIDGTCKRVKCSEEKQWQAVDCTEIVQNSSGLSEDFRLETLQTLELEWTFDSLECWKKLASWMPRVTSLKCTVPEYERLHLIGKLWPEIENLELGHGSQASSMEIEQFVVDNFHVESIIWNPCSCIQNHDKKILDRLAWMALKASPGVVLPW